MIKESIEEPWSGDARWLLILEMRKKQQIIDCMDTWESTSAQATILCPDWANGKYSPLVEIVGGKRVVKLVVYGLARV